MLAQLDRRLSVLHQAGRGKEDEARSLYADLGVDELICYVQFGYHSHESVMRTIELIGKEVLPELERYTPQPPADATEVKPDSEKSPKGLTPD